MECPILLTGDNMTNPTPEEIVEVAKSGSTGQVKTLSDIRFEKLEARFNDLVAKYNEVLKINEEYRSANSEMFAYIQSSQSPELAQVSPTLSPAQPSVPVSAQIVKDDSAEIAAKQREEANLQAVLESMGYRKPQSKIDTTTQQDGM